MHMIRNRPTVIDVARELGVSIDILHRLEREGHIPTPHRDSRTNYRIYDSGTIAATRAALATLGYNLGDGTNG
jgi:DNA-binding transcriptional MerR regulator